MPTLTSYLAAMSLASDFLDRALITEREFATYESLMCRKYGIPPNTIYRDLRLLSTNLRANIRH